MPHTPFTAMSAAVHFVLVGVVTLLCPQRAFCQPIEPTAVLAAVSPSPSGVSAESRKKVSMVIETLQDIHQSVVNTKNEETAIADKYMAWCKTEQATIANDLAESKSQLANAKILSEEQTSSIDDLQLFVKKTTKEIEETKDAVAQATALRNDENEKYNEDLQINTQSLRQIAEAIKHLNGVQQQGGFLQNGILKKLQVNQPGESSYVLGVMKGLDEKLEKTRDYLKKTEEDKVKQHNTFMGTKSQSLKAMQDALTEKKILLAETQAKETGVQTKISKLTASVDRLEKSGVETAEACDSASKEWNVRQNDRTKELAALSEAIRYVEAVANADSSKKETFLEEPFAMLPNIDGDVPTFLEIQSSSGMDDASVDEMRDTDFMSEDQQVEGHMRKETFDGVKGVVLKLISNHEGAQKEETDKKEYCQKEIASKDDEKATTTDTLAAVKADIEKKSAEVETLEDEVKKLYDSQAELRKNLEDAGKVRKQEHDLFNSEAKDRSLASRVLKQAKLVLQSFYDDEGDLLQVGGSSSSTRRADPPPKWDASSPRKKVASSGAVSMIQNIIDDMAKEQKDAAIQEKESADAFVQLQGETQRNIDEMQQDITDRVTAKAKLGVQINSLKETQTEKTDELTAIDKQLTSLHSSCDELLKNFDQRKTARAFEVSQLRDVMDVLSGSSLAARTGGFVQEDEDPHTLALEAQLQGE